MKLESTKAGEMAESNIALLNFIDRCFANFCWRDIFSLFIVIFKVWYLECINRHFVFPFFYFCYLLECLFCFLTWFEYSTHCDFCQYCLCFILRFCQILQRWRQTKNSIEKNKPLSFTLHSRPIILTISGKSAPEFQFRTRLAKLLELSGSFKFHESWFISFLVKLWCFRRRPLRFRRGRS